MKLMNRLTALPYSTYSLLLGLFAAACLGAALIGQYGFNLHPCHLCILQRIPFGIVIALGLGGFLAPKFARWTVGFSGIALLVNSGIAMYHTGIERKWWQGLTSCSAPDMSGSVEELMARIENAATTRCDEIQWEMFGLSMANYNVLVCGAAAIITALYLLKKANGPALRQ